jgi:UDP-glucose 4-epimerase
MNIIITGGMGQVGSYLAEHFHNEHSVTIIDNNKSVVGWQPPENVEIIHADIRDKNIAQFINSADIIIHTAAQVSVEKSTESPCFDADNNIMGTLNLLAAARKAEVKRFIYFSSAAIYGNPKYTPIDEAHPTEPLSPYGLSKLTGERYTLMYHSLFNLPAVCLRPFNIYSPRQDPRSPYSGVISIFIDRIKHGLPPVIFGDGMQVRDFVSVHDVVNMVEIAMKKDAMSGKVYNVGTGKPTTVRELAEIIIELFDAKVEIKYAEPRRGDIRESVADISAARKQGYKPKISLRDGLSEFKRV